MDVRVQRRDRPWAQTDVTIVCGPFQMPTTDALRLAVKELADRYPHSRLTWSLDTSQWRWRGDRSPDSVVAERDWPMNAPVGAILDGLAADRELSRPLCVIRYPDHIGLKISHSVGDGRVGLTTISAVLRSAMRGEAIPWPVQRAGLLPTSRAVLNTFVARPGLIRSVVRDRIHTSSPRLEVPSPRPWQQSRRTVHVTFQRDRADEFFEWAQTFAPLASRFALQIALVLRALRCVGLQTSSDRRLIVDLRRYLGWRYIEGNFVAGVPVRLSDDMDAEELTRSIRTTVSSGRPLANHILTSMRRSTTNLIDDSFDGNASPRMTFTDLGRSPDIGCLPFRADQPPVYAGSVSPEGPLGITFLFAETPQMVSLNAAFHDNVVDAQLLGEALELAASDPVRLMTKSVSILNDSRRRRQ